MKEMEYICKAVLDRVSGAIAFGVVDLGKKDLLELQHLPHFSPKQKVVAISASIYLFSGKLTAQLEQTVQTQFGILSEDNVDRQEVLVSFDQLSCYCKTIKKGKIALVLVTNKDSNSELVWSELKSITPLLEPLLP